MSVDPTQQHQVLAGFGSSVVSLVYGGEDYLPPALRQQAIAAVYDEVRLNMGNLDSWIETSNDNADPFTISWSGFQWGGVRALREAVVNLALPHGADELYPSHKINMREMPWAASLRQSDYQRYLNEMGEHVVSGMRYWRDSLDYAPRYVMLFNEPLSGNGELAGGSTQEVVDLVKRVGQRLRSEGFPNVMFVLPAEETEEKSLETTTAILADAEARQFVGAVAYHTYPYGSVYSSTRRILETSGSGQPDPGRIAVRQQLQALAQSYGVPLWMTEVSLGPGPQDFPFGALENLRARAIHIHDEFRYARAAAFFGMLAMWDLRSHIEHFGNDDLYHEASTIALVDQTMQTVTISGMGFAIGHYARWMERGDVVLESSSSDPLVQVTATQAADGSRLVMVLINNANEERAVTVSVQGGSLTGDVTGERSSFSERWAALPVFSPTSSTSLQMTLPAFTVTTVAVPMGVTTNDPDPGPGDGFSLGVPAPNPARGAVTVSYRLGRSGPIELAAFDVTGRKVATVAEGSRPAGAHSAIFDVAGLTEGAYLLRLTGADGVRTRSFSVVD